MFLETRMELSKSPLRSNSPFMKPHLNIWFYTKIHILKNISPLNMHTEDADTFCDIEKTSNLTMLKKVEKIILDPPPDLDPHQHSMSSQLSWSFLKKNVFKAVLI